MRLVFLGEDSFSAVVLNSLIKANYKIMAVICPFIDSMAHLRLEKLCEMHSIPFNRIADINAADSEALIKGYQPDLITINHFPKLLKKQIIDLPKIGCINLHPSLLPAYRGLSPIQQPIIHGETETGVTVHFIDEQMDTGDIIIQESVEITPTMYVSDLQRALFKIYETIVVKAIEKITTNNLQLHPQKHLKGSSFGKLRLDDCKINLEGSAQDALNLIRAVSRPYFGARINGHCIWKARMVNAFELEQLNEHQRTTGIYIDNNKQVFIKFNDGGLAVESFQEIKP